ncbi:hypothetical protein Tco_0168046 [Tanacetum coccineum]
MFEEFRERQQAANIDQSPPREMSLKEMQDLKQHYLDEMKSLSNDLQIKDYRNEKIDIRFRRECEDMIAELKKQVAKLSTYTTEPSRHFYCTFCDDDDYEESTISWNEIIFQLPPSIEITPVLPIIEEPEDSLIMGNEELSTIPEKESDEFIKSSVKDLVPIPSKSGDTSESDSDCDLPSCDDFSPINVSEEKSVTFSNPLFDSTDDFTSSDDESLFDEDVPEDNNDDLFDLESKTNDWKKILYDAPIDDLIFDPGGDIDEIDAFLDINISTDIEEGYHDSEGDILYLERLLSDDTTLSLPLKVFLDHDPRSLSDINDLKIMVKVFDPEIHFSPTYVSLSFEDRHYLSFTYLIRTFLPYFTYQVISHFPLSSGSEDIIFDPGISAFHFSSLKPVAYECPMEVCSSTCFIPNITMIWGESS